ncbi:MAG: DUF3536 domain-containing protein, partial [Longimicrobiales bacterium]|nr:DUF3536 domain-containing protein [Longimicrobiales bacterium]
MSGRYVCIHGHFYQPPRENPWLESVERQASALPYHDWNQRVTAECYAPNAASRILDDRQRIVRIINNYGRMSFNFGPTLLSWMGNNTRFTYEAILDADRASRERFGGHGSALAQVYGHLILPLANRRDKETQVRWGIRDFEHRFGRPPEGMWLSETAVDTDTLEVLAENGIGFTILSPYQAREVRPLNESDAEGNPWRDVTGGMVDPTVPYRVNLPSGRAITVFFYDGRISRAVAFEELLNDGEIFADRLLNSIPDTNGEARLVHIATDGETYGHHHDYGEMALSYALDRIQETGGVELTNYAQVLAEHPPRHEARIVEASSWSCAHGVERWRSDCGCSTGARPGWNQAWRRPLRQALDFLRDEMVPRYEEAAGDLLKDPWEARNDYVDVLLDRSPETLEAFLSEHAARELRPTEEIRARKLLELQRNAMLMFTSCGWFFADLAGIETVQVLHYAGRVIQLGEELFDDSLEEPFLQILEEAHSNVPDRGTGRQIYEGTVGAARVDLEGLAAHYALRSLFGPTRADPSPSGARTPRDRADPEPASNGVEEVYCYRVALQDRTRTEVGGSKLNVGWGDFTSTLTGETERFSYAALHVGDHNLMAGVRRFMGTEAFRSVAREIEKAFSAGELPQVVRILDREFGGPSYSLRSLFRDEQQDILHELFAASVEEAEGVLAELYRERASLMRVGGELGVSPPRVFQVAAEFVLDQGLREALGAHEPEIERVAELILRAREGQVRLDPDEVGYAARRALERVADQAADDPSTGKLRRLERASDLLLNLDFPVSAWGAQNAFHRLLRAHYPER